MTRVLVVDDDLTVRDVVRRYLERGGHEVALAGNGEDALRWVAEHDPDLVVLDLMLPGIDGLEVCRRLRERSAVPVIMLTALGEEENRIAGLELGADDYVTKPFSPRELTLRVRAVLRRRQPTSSSGSQVLERAELRLDPERHRCFVEQNEIELTAKEFALLHGLMMRPGRVMTREQLLDDVWGTDIAVTTRTIDTHLKRLREKLGPASHLIETVRGVGYRFSE